MTSTRIKALLAAILEHTKEIVLACDEHGQVTAWNIRALEVLGPPADPLPQDHILLQALRTGPVQREIQVRSGSGGLLFFEAYADVLSEDGVEAGALAILHNITEFKRGFETKNALQRESKVRASLEQTRWRSMFRATVAKTASASLDAFSIYQRIADVCVPQFADWCAVDLVTKAGEIYRVAGVHTDPSKGELVMEIVKRFPPEPEDPITRVLRSGRSELVPEVPPVLLKAIAHDEEHLALLGSLGMHSYLIVPMTIGGSRHGAITFACANSSRTYSEADLDLAEDISASTGLAAENARLYETADTQRANMELLLESTGEGIYGIDAAGLCTFINGSGASMAGYTAGELIGVNMHDRLHHRKPDGSPYPVKDCPIYRALREGQGCRVDEELFYRADGSSFPVEYSSYPIYNRGELIGAVVTFNDISARKRAEAAIRESEARYRGLFDHVTEGVYQSSPNGELLAANPALVRMLGYSSEQELRALDVADLYVNPADRADSIARLDRDGQIRNMQLHLKKKNGRQITVIENSRAVRDERGAAMYYEGILAPKPS